MEDELCDDCIAAAHEQHLLRVQAQTMADRTVCGQCGEAGECDCWDEFDPERLALSDMRAEEEDEPRAQVVIEVENYQPQHLIASPAAPQNGHNTLKRRREDDSDSNSESSDPEPAPRRARTDQPQRHHTVSTVRLGLGSPEPDQYRIVNGDRIRADKVEILQPHEITNIVVDEDGTMYVIDPATLRQVHEEERAIREMEDAHDNNVYMRVPRRRAVRGRTGVPGQRDERECLWEAVLRRGMIYEESGEVRRGVWGGNLREREV